MPPSALQPRPELEEDFETVDRRRRARWRKRMSLSLLSLVLVILGGALSTYIAGDGEYDPWAAIYFSLITVTTVGYGELPHLGLHPWARAISALTIILGIVVLAFFQSTLTALFVEGALGHAVRKRRMKKRVGKMEGHDILVGCGRVGRYVAKELLRCNHQFVVIEKNPEAVQQLEEELKVEVIYIQGDASDDEVLRAAGVEVAAGLVTTLALDRDNLFVTLSARTMNPNLRIIAKVANASNAKKLVRAGASSTISPQQIGGTRLAHELLRPEVTAFFDTMADLPEAVHFHELLVPSGSSLENKSLREARLLQVSNLLVVGIRQPDGQFLYNPGPDETMRAGARLIVLGRRDDLPAGFGR